MGVLNTFTADVESFLAETGMTPTALGVAALKDPNFVPALRAGRSPRAATIDRVYEFMAVHRAAALAEGAAA
jgi:hypothetical protein